MAVFGVTGFLANTLYRARATGVLDVQNPVRQAVETGRFEELSDSDSD